MKKKRETAECICFFFGSFWSARIEIIVFLEKTRGGEQVKNLVIDRSVHYVYMVGGGVIRPISRKMSDLFSNWLGGPQGSGLPKLQPRLLSLRKLPAVESSANLVIHHTLHIHHESREDT